MNFLIEGREYDKLMQSLNYDFKDYLNFLNNDSYNKDWKGISIQQKEIKNYNINLRIPLDKAFSFEKKPPNLEILLNNYVKLLENIFQNYGKGNWIIKHDIQDYEWILSHWKKDKRNIGLYSLFDEMNIDYSEKGALYLPYKLFKPILHELIGYPYLLNYRDLNFLNKAEDFVIRITHHFTVDIISKNKDIILEISNLIIDEDYFDIIHYRN